MQSKTSVNNAGSVHAFGSVADGMGADETGVGEKGVDETGVGEMGVGVGVGVDEMGVGVDKPGTGETGTGEMGVDETGASETGTGETGTGETGTGETGTGETGTGETGTGETGAGETGTGELGAGEMVAGETGTGELGAGETGTGELVAGETVAGVVEPVDVDGTEERLGGMEATADSSLEDAGCDEGMGSAVAVSVVESGSLVGGGGVPGAVTGAGGYFETLTSNSTNFLTAVTHYCDKNLVPMSSMPVSDRYMQESHQVAEQSVATIGRSIQMGYKGDQIQADLVGFKVIGTKGAFASKLLAFVANGKTDWFRYGKGKQLMVFMTDRCLGLLALTRMLFTGQWEFTVPNNYNHRCVLEAVQGLIVREWQDRPEGSFGGMLRADVRFWEGVVQNPLAKHEHWLGFLNSNTPGHTDLFGTFYEILKLRDMMVDVKRVRVLEKQSYVQGTERLVELELIAKHTMVENRLQVGFLAATIDPNGKDTAALYSETMEKNYAAVDLALSPREVSAPEATVLPYSWKKEAETMILMYLTERDSSEENVSNGANGANSGANPRGKGASYGSGDEENGANVANSGANTRGKGTNKGAGVFNGKGGRCDAEYSAGVVKPRAKPRAKRLTKKMKGTFVPAAPSDMYLEDEIDDLGDDLLANEILSDDFMDGIYNSANAPPPPPPPSLAGFGCKKRPRNFNK
jgi:hypothetical protein